MVLGKAKHARAYVSFCCRNVKSASVDFFSVWLTDIFIIVSL